MRLAALLVWALGLPSLCAAAPAIGTFTIVEGDVAVIRDAVKFAAVEGLRLQAEDIVQSADNAQVVRIEFTEGGVLDVGPATRLLLRPRYAEARSERPSRLYVSQGWIKLTAAPADKAGFATASFDVADLSGAAVARVRDDTSFLFVESGAAQVAERSGAAPRRHIVGAGEAYDRRSADPGVVTPRPAADMLKSMPRAFADSLPRRLSLFKGTPVAPAGAVAIAYEDVSAWVNAERSLRSGFVHRWASKAREPRFRSALIAELRSHPEWDRTLFPEKYEVKRAPEPAPTTAATEQAARAAPASPTGQVAATPAPNVSRSVDPSRDPLRPWEARRP